MMISCGRKIAQFKDCLDYLRAIPHAWLEHGKEITLKNAPTYFGKTSLHLKSMINDGRVEITIHPPERSMPEKTTLTLRLPEGKKIEAVMINGNKYKDFKDEVINLPKSDEELKLVVDVK